MNLTLVSIMTSRPLTVLKGCGVITRIEGEIGEFKRLISLGLVPGREVKVYVNGSVIVVEVDNSVLVLDRQLASKIMVGDWHEG